MNRDSALKVVQKQMTEKRFIHTQGVVETAIKLAKIYDVDQKKAELAAIFHDYAKYRPVDEMKEIVIKEEMDDALLVYGDELLHGPVGAFLVKHEVGIQDEDILNAIRYHTTGRARMTMLEKVIYIADYIEPSRSFTGVEEVRELAIKDIDQALIVSISNTIKFLLGKRQLVYPTTLAAYNFLLLKEEL